MFIYKRVLYVDCVYMGGYVFVLCIMQNRCMHTARCTINQAKTLTSSSSSSSTSSGCASSGFWPCSSTNSNAFFSAFLQFSLSSSDASSRSRLTCSSVAYTATWNVSDLYHMFWLFSMEFICFQVQWRSVRAQASPFTDICCSATNNKQVTSVP